MGAAGVVLIAKLRAQQVFLCINAGNERPTSGTKLVGDDLPVFHFVRRLLEAHRQV
jgi:hypothetical protein